MISCGLSGLIISVTKSNLLVSPRMQRVTHVRLTQITNMLVTNNIEKNLGFRFVHGRMSKHEFNGGDLSSHF